MPLKIYVAGHLGMVGSAIVRKLKNQGNVSIIGKTHRDLNLTCQADVHDFLLSEKPDQIYLAAAKVGGVNANNTLPAEFIYENLMVQANLIHGAWMAGVKKLLFLGSSCIYPRDAIQPMKESALLSGPLESTNEPYAIAKIAGIKLCESYNRQYGQTHGIDYRSIMPTNLYGPGDNYNLSTSHVIPALIRKIHEAKIFGCESVSIWGTGRPLREFLYVDDMAEASIFLMNLDKELYDSHVQPMMQHINVGSSFEISIFDLAKLISCVIGYSGKIVTDQSKPDGTYRKIMDSSLIRSFGWTPSVQLYDGLVLAYQDFLANFDNLRM